MTLGVKVEGQSSGPHEAGEGRGSFEVRQGVVEGCCVGVWSMTVQPPTQRVSCWKARVSPPLRAG